MELLKMVEEKLFFWFKFTFLTLNLIKTILVIHIFIKYKPS
jgi:hypothetical protein